MLVPRACLLPQYLRHFLTNRELSVWFFSGEALGAIGNPDVLEVLKQYSTDPVIEVPWPKAPAPAWTSFPRCLVARATA